MPICPRSIPLVLVLLLLPIVAQAKPGKDLKDREKTARKACMVGNYQEGVSILADLYIEAGDANYIFNQARCLQQNHRWEEALDRFREYLRKATSLQPAEKAQIESYVQECQGQIASAASVSPPAPVTPAPQPAAAPAVSVDSQSVEESAPTVENRGSGLRIAGIITGAVGLAGIGAGVFCSVKTYSLRRQPDELNSYKKIGIISYAAGGAALVTGAILYIVGASRRGSTPEGTTVSFIPAVGRGTGSLLLQGSF